MTTERDPAVPDQGGHPTNHRRKAIPAACALGGPVEQVTGIAGHTLTNWHRGGCRHSEPPAPMPSTLVYAIHELEHELMLVDALVTDNATAEIIRDTGTRLTIRIPGGLLPVHLTVDPPGAARLVHLLAGYADRAQVTGLVPDPLSGGPFRAENGAWRSADAVALRARLKHVYWIGGGSGAGKSTIARRIAAEHGRHVYATDDVMPDHASRATLEDAPYLSRFKRMNMDERWVTRSPETMLETFHWFRGEGFGLIVEDLLRLPVETDVIAEGFRLLPHLVKPLLAEPGHAVWLLPTPEFRQAAFDSRGTAWDIPRKTSDPELARRNLLERDRMFTDRLFEETKRLELPVIEIDTAMSEDELAGQVTQVFGL